MKRLIAIAVLVLGMMAVWPAAGGETPATRADAATTRPAGPRDVLKTVISAMYKGVPGDVAPNCEANTPDTKRFVQDTADFASAVAAIHKSAEAKFGLAGIEASTPPMASPEAVDHAEETIDGDRAFVKGDGIGDTVLVKINGQWKVDAAGLLRASGTTPDDMHLMFTRTIAAIKATAADIDAGRYANVEAMRDGLLESQGHILEEPPTTVPAK